MKRTFTVKFITPLVIGGGEGAKTLDANGLTGKALRGCWRFWFRALIGGLHVNLDHDLIAQLEERIFGSTKAHTFKLLVEPTGYKVGRRLLLPHETENRRAPTDCFEEGSKFKITVIPRSNMNEIDRKALFSVIWLWANLGAVGRRARRGFGSPVICFDTQSYQAFGDLPIKDTPFESTAELEKHLMDGLKLVCCTLVEFIGGAPAGCLLFSNKPSNAAKADYFILKSIDQIAVSATLYAMLYDGRNGHDTTGAISKVHGMSNCYELGLPVRNDLPRNLRTYKRWASPVFIRFHEVLNGGNAAFCPVVIWCEQKAISENGNCVQNFLNGIGFAGSLQRKPK